MSAEDYFERGNTYFEQGQHVQAIAEYKKALQVDQDYFMAWLRMGESYRELSKYNDAIDCYKRAVQTKPELAEAWFGMGLVYEKLKEYNRAIDCYQEAVEINPELAEAWYNMGKTYQEIQEVRDFHKAIDCFEKTVEIKPDFVESWRRLSRIYSNELIPEDWENAVRCYEKVVPIISDDPDIWGEMLFAYIQLDDFENVIRCSKKLHEVDEEWLAGVGMEEDLWIYKGEHYAKLRDFDKAIDCYQKALDIDPDNRKTWYDKGVAYGRLVESTIEKPSDEVLRKIDEINGFFTYFFPKMKKLLGISEAITDINKSVEGRKDLLYNITGLSNLIDKMNVSGLQRELNMKNEDRSINLLEAFLVKKFKKYDSRIIENLRLIQRLRSKVVHQEKSGLLAILKQMKQPYPKDKDDWRSIWDTSLNLYLQSLDLLEKILSKLFSKKD